MKKITSTILLLLLAFVVHATHLLCGDITYRRIQTFNDGAVQYEMKLTVVRDSARPNVDFDATIKLGVYDQKSLKLVDSIEMTNLVRQSISKKICLNGAIFEQGEYAASVILAKNTNGYYVTWERCCKGLFRNIEINCGNPQQPLYLIAEIPNTEIVNSSPELPFLIQGFCASTDTRWSLAMFDSDGDSLDIKLTPLIMGRGFPTPDLSIPSINSVFTPKKEVPYISGYSFLSPFGPNILVDISNNELGFNTNRETGLFNVGILVSEYRNGQLISSHTVDMAAAIFGCKNLGQDKPGGFFLDKYATTKSLVTWNTCNSQVTHFEIWRSEKDSNSFKMIDSVSRFTNRYIDSTINKSGRYYYKVKGAAMAGGKSGETEAKWIDVFMLDVDDIDSPTRINIFPNPFRDRISIESDELIEEISICNSLGQHVYVEHPHNQSVTIGTELNPGLYFITVNTGKANLTQKLVNVK